MMSLSHFDNFDDYFDDYPPTNNELAEEFVRNCLTFDASFEEFWEVYNFIIRDSDHCEQLECFNRKILIQKDPITVTEFRAWFENMAKTYAEEKYNVKTGEN